MESIPTLGKCRTKKRNPDVNVLSHRRSGFNAFPDAVPAVGVRRIFRRRPHTLWIHELEPCDHRLRLWGHQDTMGLTINERSSA